MTKFNFITRFASVQRISSNIVTMFSLRNEKLLRKVLDKYAWKLISLSTSRTKVSPRLRRFNKFLALMFKNFKHHGAQMTIKWLKACHMTVQRKLSSKPCSSLRDIEPLLPLPRLINGLPSFIGTMDRKAIREGNPRTIRLWLSILQIYRILEGPMNLKLNTITDEFDGDHSAISRIIGVSKDIITFNRTKGLLLMNSKKLGADKVLNILSAGPNGSPSIQMILSDAIAMAKYPEIYNPFMEYCLKTRSMLGRNLNNAIQWSQSMLEFHGTSWVRIPSKLSFDDLALGKLSFKEEAAGKLRVFAIADIWTQSLFKPLHDELFVILKTLPNDGTFNQDASFARSMEKAAISNCAYSVDLSSATDRLPIDLQIGILDLLSGLSIGKLWASILVDRPYMVRENDYVKDCDFVYYRTGQPMGCLSSWAMLAITHHFILQTCAFHVYGTRLWFSNYEILGDDLVIFDKLIYLEYCRLMDQLKVGVNPSKSLISEELDAIEFAKRTGVKGVDVSGLSWKQFIAEDSIMGRINLLISSSKRGLISSVPLLLRALERTKGDNLLSSPKGKEILNLSLMGLLGYFSNSGYISLKDAVSFTVDPQDEDLESLDKPSLPITMTLHSVLSIMNLRDKFVTEKGVSTVLSSYEDRAEIAKTEVLPFMADSLVREAVSRMLLFTNNYDDALSLYSKTLVNKDFQLESLSSIERSQLVSFSEETLLRGRDPQDMYDEIFDFAYGLKEMPTMDEANYFSSKVDAFCSSFKFESLSKVNKRADVSWLSKDIALAGTIQGTPYWRLLS